MRPLLALAFLAGPALAQGADHESVRTVDADLDGDGRAETYALRDSVDPGGMDGSSVDLIVTDGTATRVLPDVAWTGGPGQMAYLALSPSGSVEVISHNDAIGRNRWSLTLTLAHRGGALKIAGITYSRWDTIDPNEGWGTCDLNLLSGQGIIDGPSGQQEITVPGPAPALSEWQAGALPAMLPAECFG